MKLRLMSVFCNAIEGIDNPSVVQLLVIQWVGYALCMGNTLGTMIFKPRGLILLDGGDLGLSRKQPSDQWRTCFLVIIGPPTIANVR